jgi:hypothetical protein
VARSIPVFGLGAFIYLVFWKAYLPCVLDDMDSGNLAALANRSINEFFLEIFSADRPMEYFRGGHLAVYGSLGIPRRLDCTLDILFWLYWGSSPWLGVGSNA